MISKELLCEVLNFNFQGLRDYKVDRFCFPNENTIAVEYKNEDGWIHINIYELAHKCKKWAKQNGYILQSSISCENKGFCMIGLINNTVSNWVEIADTEPKAVFKACQWIIEDNGYEHK